ncbi:MAG TPA: large conductance mechanosensitive channel protein MscL [Clostridia bacterium]|nr:large conductance mechanosensitive channel protein MscL [Clostridia bacterium]
MFGEFKTFALRGNVMDLAVGVIIGGAFQKIVTSAISNLITPLIGCVTGRVNFDNLFIVLSNTSSTPTDQIKTLDQANKLAVATFNYGAFITNLLDFVIMAFVVFLMVKGINRLTSISLIKKPEAAAKTKKCPYCCSDIDVKATRCPHCTSKLGGETADGE